MYQNVAYTYREANVLTANPLKLVIMCYDGAINSLKIAREAYRELFGREPQAKAIHAGLECGVIGERYPGMDMISFGPTLEGAHSPEERMYIDTVEKFWDLLLGILRRV